MPTRRNRREMTSRTTVRVTAPDQAGQVVGQALGGRRDGERHRHDEGQHRPRPRRVDVRSCGRLAMMARDTCYAVHRGIVLRQRDGR